MNCSVVACHLCLRMSHRFIVVVISIKMDQPWLQYGESGSHYAILCIGDEYDGEYDGEYNYHTSFGDPREMARTLIDLWKTDNVDYSLDKYKAHKNRRYGNFTYKHTCAHFPTSVARVRGKVRCMAWEL